MPAPKGNRNAAGGKGGGRRPVYKKEYAKMANALSLLGLTDAEMAKALDVSETTLHGWKKQHVEFYEALKKGKESADAKVADRLYQRALGYSHPEEKIFHHNGEIVRAQTIKHYPPDPVSAIFWLRNRQGKYWRNKPEDEPDKDKPAPVKVELTLKDARKDQGHTEPASD